jgi:hypothetical protein
VTLSRRTFIKRGVAGAAATAVISGHPRFAGAQTKSKGQVRLAYLQLGWAGTEIIHKEDLLGKHGCCGRSAFHRKSGRRAPLAICGSSVSPGSRTTTPAG